MKIVQYLIIFILCIAQLKGQDRYYVTYLKGNVKKLDGKVLVPGDQLLLSENILFDSGNGQLVLLNPEKGRLVISADANKMQVNNKGNVLVVLKDYLKMNPKSFRLSARGPVGAGIKLSDYFTVSNPEINTHLLIIDSLVIPLNKEVYGIVDNKQKYFFLQIPDSVELLNKLVVKDNALTITENDLIFNSKNYTDLNEEIMLAFSDSTKIPYRIKRIAFFSPAWISKKAFLKLMNSIKNGLPNQSRDTILQEIYEQCYLIYGQLDKAEIERLYDTEIK